MKFGLCCGGATEAQRAVAAGFDYVEMPATEFDGLFDTWNPLVYHGLRVEATNLFFASEVKLFGESRIDYWTYVERTLERAALKGVQLMVIGSGGSRRMPEDSLQFANRDGAFAQIAGRIAARAKAGYGIKIAPESLNRTETNVGNDLGRLARLLEGTDAGYTADTFHVLREWDADGRKVDLDGLWAEQLPYAPSHVHIADLTRHSPKPEDPTLIGFVGRLKALGYDARVSLECRRDENTKLGPILRDMKELFGAGD